MLGLPFDALDIDAVSEQIRCSSIARRQCVISTPNLNFIVASLNDSDFRDTVIGGEFSLLDGMPLLWIARLLNLGVKEKVSGSDLFEFLSKEPESETEKLRVFFFGGEEGAGQRACEELNSTNRGVTCVGFLNPGVGSFDKLSSSENLQKINQSKAEFLIIALGAKKGQLWIDYNRSKLDTPVISHLGAVINFASGRVKRAPSWMQRTGLEWTWRIAQEPNLWRRYLSDGLIFTRLFLTRVVPYRIWLSFGGRYESNDNVPVKFNVEKNTDDIIVFITGICLDGTIEPLRTVFSEVIGGSKRIVLDLSGVPVVDGAFLGLCLVLFKHVQRAQGNLAFTGLNKNVRRIFRWNCVEFLL